ncbi:MAG: uncharacterized protein JWP97_5815 [Labilithrix sp.]|nr:uncharacterized protein [Labilithrix sp.]
MKHSLGRFLLGSMVAGALVSGLYACADDATPGDDTDVDASTGAKDASRPDVSLPDEDAESPGQDAGKKDAGDAGKSDSGVDAGKDAAADASGPAYLDDAGTVTVVRVGTAGGGALTSASTAVFLENHTLSSGAITKTTALPIAPAGAQNAFTLRGTGTTEGGLARSVDGNFLVLAGYGAAPGVATINTSTSALVPRVVARVAKDSTIDTSTVLTGAFDTGAPRSVASTDGTTFWVAGEGGMLGVTGGVWTAAFGGTTATQIFGGPPTNLRSAGIFGDQLFASSQSGADLHLFAIGTGLPTTAGQTGTQLPGVAVAGSLPHGFVMLDLDGTPGLDTLYVADTNGLGGAGGVQKWTFAAGTWTLAATFKTGLTSAPVFLTAKVIGTNVVLLGVTGETLARIVRIIDDGVNTNPTAAVLGTAAAGSQYRGLAVTPAP